MAVRANSVSSVYGLNESGAWVAIAERPAAAVDGAWDVLHTGSHLLLLTSEPNTHRITVNTLDLNSVTNHPLHGSRFNLGPLSLQVR